MPKKEKISRYNHRYELLEDDIFLVSYPKSGNTWLRFLIGNYLSGNKCSFRKIDFITACVYLTSPEFASQMEQPRFIKSHEPWTPDYKRVVYLVRDARDVAVSYYFYNLKFRKIESGTTFSEFIKQFNAGSVGIFGNWVNHVNYWLNLSPENFLLLKYENMLDDTEYEFRKLLDFCDIPIDENRLLSAIETSKFENMRKLEEQEEKFAQNWGDPSIRFVRKGGSQNWKEYFTDDLLNTFITVHGNALARLDYITAEEYGEAMIEKSKTLTIHPLNDYQNMVAELHKTKNDYQKVQSELHQAEVNIQQENHKVKRLKRKIEKRNKQKLKLILRVNNIRDREKRTEAKLTSVSKQLDRCQQSFDEMKASRLWKLKNYWSKVKSNFKK
ncbi:MAG: sulfotransferase domain-containing protein [Cyanobacteria bacterium P01_E01_bin.6]